MSTDLSRDDTAEVLARLDAMSAQLTALTEQVAAIQAAREQWGELGHEVTSLGEAGMTRLTNVLQTAEDKGYFRFARGSAAIADRVVTSYDEEDIAALSDNVVTILDAMKELTQPELMGLLHRAARTLQDTTARPAAPPSTLALLRSMRDPQARRGIGRLLAMLHAIGDEPHAHPESGALTLDHRRPETRPTETRPTETRPTERTDHGHHDHRRT